MAVHHIIRGHAGFQPEQKGTALEVTQRLNPRKLQIGSGFRHFTVAVESIKDTVKRSKLLGYKAYEGQEVDEKHTFVQACACASAGMLQGHGPLAVRSCQICARTLSARWLHQCFQAHMHRPCACDWVLTPVSLHRTQHSSAPGHRRACGLQDPSGYPWELVYKAESIKEPFREVSLLVSDLQRSIKFYRDGLGMKVTTSKSTDGYTQVHTTLHLRGQTVCVCVVACVCLPTHACPVQKSRHQLQKDRCKHCRDAICSQHPDGCWTYAHGCVCRRTCAGAMIGPTPHWS